MKIDALAARNSSLAAQGRSLSGRTKTDTASFSDELSDQDGGLNREQMQQLLQKIDEQGAKLTKTPTYDELKEYRSLIKTFVGEAVSQMYATHSQAGWDRLGRQKVYTTVRKIDMELENMAEHIRLGQTDSLTIVASQDAIRGMLVDLYM